ncbi:MAG: SAM-dependent methyltransferase [Acidobacteria bacterium]|nr:SAM-dependent methyltransferase [Acidobacteriota bacterium]
MLFYLGIALTSATILGLELALMRVFSITQWHHFAFMIISLALLGFGASGTFLSLFQHRFRSQGQRVPAVAAVAGSLSILLTFWVSQRLPFSLLRIIWDWHQYGYLLLLYLLFSVPFFLLATVVGWAFLERQERISRIYFFDLAGAGIGALVTLAALSVLKPSQLPAGLSVLSMGAALFLGWSLGRRWQLMLAAALLVPVVFLVRPLGLNISQYKGLSYALQLPGARLLAERNGPLGMVQVVDSPAMRYAPELSLNFQGTLPQRLGVYVDAELASAITHFDGRWEVMDFLDYSPQAAPYRISPRRSVLILGAGAGTEVLAALFHRAQSVDAVELNGQLLDLLRSRFSDFAGGLYTHPSVSWHVAEARGFAEAQRRTYDLIQIAPLDAFAASSAGVFALAENYVYTREAFRRYLELLEPSGILAVTRWVKLPPRDNLKTFATAVEALRTLGLEAAPRLFLLRNWGSATLLVKKSPLSPEEVARLKDFCEQRSFDLAYYPGILPEEANRFHLLEHPYYYEAAQQILSLERESFYEKYRFQIRPATDEKPYFFHFFKWETFRYVWQDLGRQGMVFAEWGSWIQAATLFQAAMASFVLILLPLFFLREKPSAASSRFRCLVYFSCLGLAYLFLEIMYIQKFILFLAHPVYAAAVVLASFLVFSGLGSLRTGGRPATVRGPVLGITCIAGLEIVFLALVFRAGSSLALGWKMVLSVVLIAPLAFFMGQPFPLGLRAIRGNRSLVAWSWGINGFFSVLSTLLAPLLAMTWGFRSVLVAALALYWLASRSLPAPRQRPSLVNGH